MNPHGTTTTNGYGTTPQLDPRIVRLIDERLAIMRRVLEDRFNTRIDERVEARFAPILERIEFELAQVEDLAMGEGPDPDETDEED